MVSAFAAEAEWVCALCGTPSVKNKFDRWFHVDSIPDPFEPHDVIPITARDFAADTLASQSTFISLKDAARDMLAHHVTGHPESECRFAQNLREAVNR